jgi:hypothetical protein
MEVSVSFKPRPFYSQKKSTRNPLDKRLGGLKNRSRCGGEENKYLSLQGIEPHSFSP